MEWSDTAERRVYRATRRGVVILLMVLSGGACSVGERIGQNDPIILMHRAILAGNTEEWTTEARHRLGCNPCETFDAPGRGNDPAVFLFSRDSPMHLVASDVVSSSIVPSRREGHETVYLLLLTLSESGKQRLASYIARYPKATTINEARGSLMGLNPLALSSDQYVAGRLSSEREAMDVARSIGAPFELEQPVHGSDDRDQDI